MSNAQWPGQGNQNSSPWARQDPNWRPQQFHDAPARDPRQPFGQQPGGATQPAWDPELPKGSPKRIWYVVGAIVIVAAVVLGMLFLGGPQATSTVSPSGAMTCTRTRPSGRRWRFSPAPATGHDFLRPRTQKTVNRPCLCNDPSACSTCRR